MADGMDGLAKVGVSGATFVALQMFQPAEKITQQYADVLELGVGVGMVLKTSGYIRAVGAGVMISGIVKVLTRRVGLVYATA